MRPRLHLVLAAVALCTSATAFAQAAPPPLAELAAGAAAIVHSKVSAVDYRAALGADGSAALPYAIVTFAVIETIAASPAGKSFKLRVPGGPDGRGGFYDVEGAPIFQTGDEDILFVRDAGAAGCPLAGCLSGRFRILAGSVYDGEGAPASGLDEGRIIARGPTPDAFLTIRYPTPDFDQLIENPAAQEILSKKGLSIDEARIQYKKQAPPSIEIRRVEAREAARDMLNGKQTPDSNPARAPMSVKDFVAVVASAAQGAHTPAKRIPSFDESAPAASPSFAATAPIELKTATPPLSKEEALAPKDDLSRLRAKAQ